MLVRTPPQNTAWILLPPCSGAFGGSRCSQNEGRNPPHRSPLHTVLPSLVSLSVLRPLSSSSSVPFLCHRTLTGADPPAGASRSSLPSSPLSDLSSGKTDPTPRSAPAPPAHYSLFLLPPQFPFYIRVVVCDACLFLPLVWAPRGQESVWFCSLLFVSRAWQMICFQ